MSPRIEQLADGITLYHGDCLEILPTLGAVDHVICDPPYEDHMHNAKRANVKRLDNGPALKVMPFKSITDIRDDAARLMTAASQGWLLVFCTPEGVALWRDVIEAAGARYKRACAWVKPDSAPQLNGQGPAMGFENLIAAWAGKGHSRWNGGGRRGVFTHNVNPPSRQGEHPTEKPVALMMEIITLFTDAGQTVCDPFMGSGTTGIAALRLGRRFIGIEKDEKWFDLSCRRINSALKQTDFFVSVPVARRQQFKMDLGSAK
jgi:site-specific DNA-methyltransferase (adenine-specific)